ncbi:MAG TPA: hypothetical protein VN688_27975 [Gemmataceae bacterium]|nr:hypothetical protein [Gemmataceae bacterium]
MFGVHPQRLVRIVGVQYVLVLAAPGRYPCQELLEMRGTVGVLARVRFEPGIVPRLGDHQRLFRQGFRGLFVTR